MDWTISYSDLLLLGKPVEENVETLISEGAKHIELLLDGETWDDSQGTMDRSIPYLLNAGVSYSVHPPAWDTNLSSENQAIRDASFDEYRKSILFAHRIGAKHVVIHPGFCFSPAFSKQTAIARAEDAVNRLCRIASPLGIQLAVENVGYHGNSLFTEDEYVRFVQQLDDSAVYLVDTGHAHLNGWNIPALLQNAAPRLGSVHLHDNFGSSDEHLPIGNGSIEWGPIYEVLSSMRDCQMILEYAPGTDPSRLRSDAALLLQRLDRVTPSHSMAQVRQQP
jgi:sugar phosphate isomerase/epimerase